MRQVRLSKIVPHGLPKYMINPLNLQGVRGFFFSIC
jgi:hypothetical protein